MHPGPFQGASGVPVHRRGHALHEQERLLFQAADQGVPECRHHRRVQSIFLGVPERIAVLRHNIQFLCPAEVVQRIKGPHHIDSHGSVAVCTHSRRLRFAEIEHLVTGKPLPVQLQAMEGHFTIGHRAVDLFPVGDDIGPEAGPPGMVQIVQGTFSRYSGRLSVFSRPARKSCAEWTATAPSATAVTT